MKQLKRIYLMAAVAVLTAGCNEQQEPVDSQGRTPVNLGYTVVESGPTRAATDLNEDYLSSGTLKVSMKAHAAADYPAFVAYTAADGGALTPPPSGRFYYPLDDSPVDLVACYPSETFTAVETDQTTDEAYLASDLMWAKVENQQPTTHTVNLQLRHLMSKIVVNASAGDGVTSINSVTLKNVKPGVSFTPATGAIGEASGSAGSITMANGGAALIPPQTIDGTFLEIATDLGTAAYAVDSKAFLSGYQYTLTITVNSLALGTTIPLTGWTYEGQITVGPSVNDLSIFDDRAPAGVEAVDLGIVVDGKKILFANMNLGATSVTGYGQYFAWGETTGYGGDPSDGRSFDWANYKWSAGSKDGSQFSKYVPTSQNSYWGGAGDPDNKLVLGYSDDAARVNWGGDWRMPTKTEMEALCALTKEWVPNYNSTGVAGYTFTGNGNTIFLPAAGCRSSTDDVYDLGLYSFYRSSTLDGDKPYNAWFMDFRDYYANMSSCERFFGGTIRPVKATLNPPFRMASSATSDDLGKIICSNGHIHSTVSDVDCGGSAVAMIVHVGEPGSADNSSSTYKGLAIALTDATPANSGVQWYETNSGTCVYQNSMFSNHYNYADMKGIENTNQMADQTGNCTSHTTHAAATAAKNYSNTVAVPTGCSQWFLPTSGQWMRFFRNSKLNLTWSDWGYCSQGASGFTNVNRMFTDAGASGAVFSNGACYWSSSEYDSGGAVDVTFYSSDGVRVSVDSKYYEYSVRAFLAF